MESISVAHSVLSFLEDQAKDCESKPYFLASVALTVLIETRSQPARPFQFLINSADGTREEKRARLRKFATEKIHVGAHNALSNFVKPDCLWGFGTIACVRLVLYSDWVVKLPWPILTSLIWKWTSLVPRLGKSVDPNPTRILVHGFGKFEFKSNSDGSLWLEFQFESRSDSEDLNSGPVRSDQIPVNPRSLWFYCSFNYKLKFGLTRTQPICRQFSWLFLPMPLVIFKQHLGII